MLENSNHNNKFVIKLGQTQASQCNYLPNQQEQLLIVLQKEELNSIHYQQLLQLGFRRSGNDVYRPYCQSCSQCQSIRLPVEQFVLSKSQKRIVNKNKDLSIKFTNDEHKSSFDLYQKYINQMHPDGGMSPANREQYEGFLKCDWLNILFMEISFEDQLIGIAVCDVLPEGLSAVYFYYDPDFKHRSLGVFSVLSQIEYLKQINKPWLYLGFQIDDCNKMNYKTRFKPYQRLIKESWIPFS